MNPLLAALAGGDIRSDGEANRVADLVAENPGLVDDLTQGLLSTDGVVRARTSHALERLSRSKPELFANYLPLFIRTGKKDREPTVRWHIAMLLGNLTLLRDQKNTITSTLLHMLDDESVFVKSWTIVSLCLIAREYPDKRGRILKRIAPLKEDRSAAIRARARKAVELLMFDGLKFPAGWIKRTSI